MGALFSLHCALLSLAAQTGTFASRGGGGVVVPELCYLMILQATHHVVASLANHDRSACTIGDVDRLGMHECVELGKLSDGC